MRVLATYIALFSFLLFTGNIKSAENNFNLPKGIIYQIAIMTPRKPNSAKRTFAKVRVTISDKKIFAKIPGIGRHFLQAHSTVLIRGHGPKDSPGINYHLVRGAHDFHRLELFGRKNRRSKFGVKKIRYE